MNRVDVFVKRQRAKRLETWTMRAIIAEAFFLALFPSFASAAVLFGIVTWLLRLRLDSKFTFRSLPFDVPVAIFALICLVSVFCSAEFDLELIYKFCSLFGICALTYILVGQNVRTREQVKQLALALGASALLVVLWGYFQYIFGIDTVDMKWVDPEKFPELRKRVFSTLENPNVLAGYLDVFICLTLGMIAKVSGRTQRFAMVLAVAMLAACLAMTYSRGAYFTIALVFIVYGIIQDWRALIFFILVTGGILYYDASFFDRLLSIFTATDSSEGLRIGVWISTFAMIADHPFIGIGWGAFKSIYPSYDYYLRGTNVEIFHAHNIFLHMAAEVGIIGTMAFCWYFFGTMLSTLELGANKKFIAIKDKLLSIIERISGIEFKKKITETADEVKDKYLIESGRLDRIIEVKEMTADKVAEASDKFMDWISPEDTEEALDSTEKVSLEKKVSLKKKISLKKKKKKTRAPVEKKAEANSEPNSDQKLAPSIEEAKTASTEVTKTASTEVTKEIPFEETIKISIVEDEPSETKKSLRAAFEAPKHISPPEDEDSDQRISSNEDEDAEDKKIFDWNEVAEINNRQIADGVKFGIGLAFLSMTLNGLTDNLLFNIPSSMLMWMLGALGGAITLLPENDVVKRRSKS